MQDINVLVVFASRTGGTEHLALAAGLGAVQAKANIRLRWLREAIEGQAIKSVPGWKENRERMEKEYIAPRTVDSEWADAIVIAASGASPEFSDYLATLQALSSQGKLAGKIAAAFSSRSHADSASILAALAQLDFILVPSGSQPMALEKARRQGRRVTEVARALKADGTRDS
ncbi:MAG: NAD(P)H dehydrogenase [Bryobacteraceae bacterium]|jgi:NAD(P)H dehydrogenase (quinone)